MAPQDDKQAPRPVGEEAVAPVPLDPRQQELGRRLDALFSANGRTGEHPSEWLSGVVFASQDRLRKNPDWVAQAAHSLREILYRLCSPVMGGGDDVTREYLTNYGSARDVEMSLAEVKDLYSKLCSIAHHQIRIEDTAEGTFENLMTTFERVMTAALERQLDVHREVDDFFSSPPEQDHDTN